MNYLIPDGSTGYGTYRMPRSPAKEVWTSFRCQPPSPRSHHNLRKSHRHSQPFASTHESSRPQNKVTDVLQTCISPMCDQVLKSSQICFTDTQAKKGTYTFYRCLPYPYPTVIATLKEVIIISQMFASPVSHRDFWKGPQALHWICFQPSVTVASGRDIRRFTDVGTSHNCAINRWIAQYPKYQPLRKGIAPLHHSPMSLSSAKMADA